MHNFFSIKLAYEKNYIYSNKQSFQNKIHLSQSYRGYYMHIFFSIKFAYEKYISHRNKQSFQKKINIVTPDKSPLSTISVGILKFFKTIVRPWQAGVLKKGLQYMTICKRTGDKGTRCRHKKIIPKLPKHKEPTLSHHIPHTLSIRQYQNLNHLPSTVHTPTPTRMFVCTYIQYMAVYTYTYIHTCTLCTNWLKNMKKWQLIVASLQLSTLFNIFHPLYNGYHLPLLENDSHPHHKHTEATLCIIFSVSNSHMKNIMNTAAINHLKKGSTCHIIIQRLLYA